MKFLPPLTSIRLRYILVGVNEDLVSALSRVKMAREQVLGFSALGGRRLGWMSPDTVWDTSPGQGRDERMPDRGRLPMRWVLGL